ncbi:MAG: VWA domain-containing protein [Candidatus Acidiferrales bacterium]
MRKWLRVSVLFAAAALALSIASAQQPAPTPAPQAPPATAPQNPPPPQNSQATIRTKAELVYLVATVTDRRHKFITDLEKNDFQISDEGKKQPLEFFTRETDLPLRIGVLLDTSNSIRERLRFEQEAASDFLYNTIRRGKDMAFVAIFDNDPEVIQDYTDNLDQLNKAIQAQRAGGGTALRDAVYMASQKLQHAPLPETGSTEVRRVLVVISDGEDNLSDRPLSESMEMAEKAEVAIYAISTNTDWLNIEGDTPKKIMQTHGDKVLDEFASDTGGRVFFPYKIDDLAQSFLDIGNELRSQYLLAFAPGPMPPKGQFRRVQVEVDRKGLIVRSRKGYSLPRVAAGAPPPVTPPSDK